MLRIHEAESLILEVSGCRDLERSRCLAQGEPQPGRSVKADDLARKAEKAIALPGAQNAFRRIPSNAPSRQFAVRSPRDRLRPLERDPHRPAPPGGGVRRCLAITRTGIGPPPAGV
jgi:hypothetical protein